MSSLPVPVCRQLEPGTAGERSQCPIDMGAQDPDLEAATEGSLEGGLVRLTAGYDPKARTFSRTRASFQIFGGLELGWAHEARSNAAEVLTEIAKTLPDAATWAWGEHAAELQSEDLCGSLVAEYNGRTTHLPAYDWLLAGWHGASVRADVSAVYARHWHRTNVDRVVAMLEAVGARGARTLAAGVRMNNSARTWIDKLKIAIQEKGETEGVTATLESYGHPDRTARIADWFGAAQVERWPSPDDLAWPSVSTAIVYPSQVTYQSGLVSQLRSLAGHKAAPFVLGGVAAATGLGLWWWYKHG